MDHLYKIMIDDGDDDRTHLMLTVCQERVFSTLLALIHVILLTTL